MAENDRRSERDLIRGRDRKEDAFLDSMAPGAEADPEKVRVGQRIKALREKRGLTLSDLAAKTGFSTALLSQMENQVISPPLGAMIHLARALECSLGELVHDLSGEAFAIVREGERRPASRFASTSGVSYGYAYESLAEVGGGPFTPFLVTLEPGAAPGRPRPTTARSSSTSSPARSGFPWAGSPTSSKRATPWPTAPRYPTGWPAATTSPR